MKLSSTPLRVVSPDLLMMLVRRPDPSTAIKAETMKLHGNSGYGRTLTNKEKHLDIRYCNEANIGRVVNDSHFRKLDIIDEDLYEVSKTKKSISMNLPIQIGFFVYQYAKLRMLEFYYDFVFEIYQILFAFYSQQKLAKHHLFATVSY